MARPPYSRLLVIICLSCMACLNAQKKSEPSLKETLDHTQCDCPLVAATQTGSICGHVVDENFHRLKDVKVELYAQGSNPPVLALTDSNGSFCFQQVLPSPGYTLRCERFGYNSVVRRGVIVREGEVSIENVQVVDVSEK